jgi:chemotaxis protein histidine kinase CheA
MATLSEYFETEARDYLARLDRELERPRPDAAGLHGAARALRGSAQMAREERVLRAAGALEAAARAVAEQRLNWSSDLAARARQTVADLRVLVARRQSAASLDTVADAAVGRWREAGVTLPVSAAKRAPGARASGHREFRAFAAREVTAIAEALDRGVQQLAAEPMDREPLKMILRRQRALLGAARLQEIPIVAEILRAIDDLTRVIAKLDVGVKREWLDIYRIAREALRATIPSLQQDEDPRPSHALSRLRHMREELLERYGAGEVVSAAHVSAGFTQATPLEQAPDQLVARELETVAAGLADPPEPAAVAAAPLVPPEAELLLDDEVVLELELEDVAGEAVLERDRVDEGPVLELDLVADEPILELDDVAEPPLLELVELEAEAVLELEADSIVASDAAEPAGLEVEEVAAEPAAVPIESLVYQRDEALRRALELRDLVALSAIDPVTHEAIDELFDLIGIALG